MGIESSGDSKSGKNWTMKHDVIIARSDGVAGYLMS